MKNSSQRIKALSIALAGSVFVVIFIILLIWGLRTFVLYLGDEYSTNQNNTVNIDDSASATGIVDGVVLGLQSTSRSAPYQLEVLTYVAKDLEEGSIKDFNKQIQDFINNIRVEFESELQGRNNLVAPFLKIESVSIYPQNGNHIVIEYKVSKSADADKVATVFLSKLIINK